MFFKDPPQCATSVERFHSAHIWVLRGAGRDARGARTFLRQQRDSERYNSVFKFQKKSEKDTILLGKAKTLTCARESPFGGSDRDQVTSVERVSNRVFRRVYCELSKIFLPAFQAARWRAPLLATRPACCWVTLETSVAINPMQRSHLGFEALESHTVCVYSFEHCGQKSHLGC